MQKPVAILVVALLALGALAIMPNAAAAPAVTTISPDSGSENGGTVITITGSGFGPGSQVCFAADCSLVGRQVVVDSTGTHITVESPPKAVSSTTAVPVLVKNLDGQSTQVGNGFSYVNGAAPTTTGMAPASGTSSGGTLITVTGTNFDTNAQPIVTFGTTAAPVVSVDSSSSMTVVTPAHAAGIVSVTVTYTSGSSNTQSFTYNAAAVPTVTSVSPASGTSNGGNTVTITGTGFAPGATVCFKVLTVCTDGTKVVVSGTTTITTLAPAMTSAATGNQPADVIVSNPDTLAATVANGYTFIQANDPAVTGLFPTGVPTVGGTVVSITGTDFAKGLTVCVVDTASGLCGAGLDAPVVDVPSSTQIFAVAPEHPAGSAFLRVTNPDGSLSAATSSLPLAYVVPQPILTATPSSGSANGGTTVTLTSLTGGFPCSATYQVYFFTTLTPSGASVDCTNDDTLTVVSPGHAAGAADITVVSSKGPLSVLQKGFTYTAASTPTLDTTGVSPTSGSANGATVVTLTGTNFACPQASAGATKPTVRFGTTAVPPGDVTCTGPTTMTVKTPPHVAATSITVQVTNPSGQSTNTKTYTYTAFVPTVATASPATGSINGGDAVTITGTHFDCTPATTTVPALSVTFGSTQAVITAADRATCTGGTTPNFSSSITVHDPGHSSGAVTVTVTNPSGESGHSGSSAFTYSTATAPTLLTASPASGGSLAGTAVTLTGTNFACTNEVKPIIVFGGTAASPAEITCNSAASLTVQAPPHAVGLVGITYTNPGGQGTSLNNAYTYTASASPVLSSLSSTIGTSLGTTMTTLTGTGFYCNANQPKPTVTFGGTPVPTADLTCTSSTSLTAKLPQHSAGFVNVVVANPDGQAATVVNGFRFLAAPATLTAATPASGSKLGSTFTSLTGTNFLIGGSVLFGDTAAQQVANPDATHLRVKTPAHTVGAVDVTYLDQDFQAVTAKSLFTFVETQAPVPTSITPDRGSVVGGTSVTITGARFQSDGVVVCFGGTPASATCADENKATSVTVASGGASLTAVSPAHALGTVTVTVINGDGEPEPAACGIPPECSPPLTFAFLGTDVLVVPTVASIAPNQGVPAGGTAVTITGAHFTSSGTTTVTFGGQAATEVAVASATTITAKTPAHAAGAVDVVITNNGQSATLTGGFTYTESPSSTSPTTTPGTTPPVTTPGTTPGTTGTPGEITASQILAANKKVKLTVTRSGEDNVLSWTLPSTGLPGTVQGVQVWRSNSPYALVKTIPSGDAAFASHSYTDTGSAAKATTKYLVTMYYGASSALGFFTDSSAPDTAQYAGTASVDKTSSSGSTGGLPNWAIVLIVVGILFLVVLVAILIARGRNREGGQGAAAQGYAWQETTEQKAAEGEWQPPAEVHQARCPSCGTSFTATGSKPIVTVCPGCGKKGILR